MDGWMDGWMDGRWSIGFIHVFKKISITSILLYRSLLHVTCNNNRLYATNPKPKPHPNQYLNVLLHSNKDTV